MGEGSEQTIDSFFSDPAISKKVVRDEFDEKTLPMVGVKPILKTQLKDKSSAAVVVVCLTTLGEIQ